MGLAVLVALGAVVGCERDPAQVIPDRPDAATDLTVMAEVELQSPGATIEIATWNVERFFDLTCDSGRCGPGDFEAQPTFADFEREADRVADGILALDADVVLLQEIESEACMIELRERLPTYPVGLIAETGQRGGINVGLVARGELVAQRRWGDLRLTRPDGSVTSFAREFLEVQLELGDGDPDPDVVVFVAHFKSKSNDDPGRRFAEAEAANMIVANVAAEFPDALVVLGGDLNDTPESEPLQALTAGGVLARAGADVSADLVATYTFNGNDRAIDHLLWAPAASGRYVALSARARTGIGEVGWYGSDHRALEARFELP